MGLIPYIKTGTSASSDLMNDLYSGLDEAVNLVTNGKSMFFLNGTTTNWSLNNPERYYHFHSGMGYITPDQWPQFTFGEDVQTNDPQVPGGTIPMSPRQFWFLSGVKSGDCVATGEEPNIEHCIGPEWKTPRRIDATNDIGWYWKLYGRHYWYLTYYRDSIFLHPPVYKHEYHEKMVDDITIFAYNTGDMSVAVLEAGIKTSNYGRFPNEWSNPYTRVTERQRIPYITDAGWSLGQEFDNSLQVHKVAVFII